MKKRTRGILAGIALAALTAGCVLVSGQFLVQVELGDLSVNSAAAVQGLYVDLPSKSAYRDHKNDIKTLEDVALLGSVHNTGTSSVTVSVYLIDGNSGPLPLATIISPSGGKQVWGPLTVAAGATEVLDWDRSSKLFGSGKSVLLDEIKNGGQFTLYLVSSTTPFEFEIKDAVFVAVIGAAK